MTYFLGRDLHAAITTEHKLLGVSVVAGSGNAYVDNVKIAEVSSINESTDIATMTGAHGLLPFFSRTSAFPTALSNDRVFGYARASLHSRSTPWEWSDQASCGLGGPAC